MTPLERRRPTAFVLCMDANGLGVARTLGRQGIPVVGVDSRPHSPGLRSKYVRPLVCPAITEDPGSALDALAEAAQECGGKGILFPTSDPFVLFVSRHRDKLSRYFDFLMLPREKEELMVSKRLQYTEAKRLGVPVADTYYPRSPEDLGCMEKLSFPACVRPVQPHVWSEKMANKGFIVRDEAELRRRLMETLSTGLEVMVQPIIMPPGKDLYSVGAYFGREGYVSPSIIWHKIRQFPPKLGVGSLVESAHQPEVEALGMRFMKGIGYLGIGYVEFKRDERDGAWKMLELNARTGQTNALQAAAGMPLALFEYQDLAGEELPRSGDYRDHVLWWNGLDDLNSYWTMRGRGEIRSGEWVLSWLRSDVHAYYAPDDKRPVFRRYRFGLELARQIINLLKTGRSQD